MYVQKQECSKRYRIWKKRKQVILFKRLVSHRWNILCENCIVAPFSAITDRLDFQRMSLKVCYFEELVSGDHFKINILSYILYLTLILRLV